MTILKLFKNERPKMEELTPEQQIEKMLELNQLLLEISELEKSIEAKKLQADINRVETRLKAIQEGSVCDHVYGTEKYGKKVKSGIWKPIPFTPEFVLDKEKGILVENEEEREYEVECTARMQTACVKCGAVLWDREQPDNAKLRLHKGRAVQGYSETGGEIKKPVFKQEPKKKPRLPYT